MRVAIIHYTAPPVAGGAENVIQEHIRLLEADGHVVTVIAGRGRQSAMRGASSVRVPILAATHPSQRTLAEHLATGEIPGSFSDVTTRITRELKPCLRANDVVLAHNVFTLHFNLALTASLAALAGDCLSGRFVAWTHDLAWINPIYVDELHPGFPWDLLKAPLPGVRYICVSGARALELKDLWRSTTGGSGVAVSVIPNGIDTARQLSLSPAIRDVVLKHELRNRDIVLMLPVRITRRKNIELAIEVVSELVRRGINAILIVTGPTAGHHPQRSRSYVSDLITLADSLSVSDRVLFLAHALARVPSSHEVSDLYAISDVMLLPSRSEGFGLPILEAALHRVPVVASDLEVFREVGRDMSTYFPAGATTAHVARLVEQAASQPLPVLRSSTFRTYDWAEVYKQEISPLLREMTRDVEAMSRG